MTGHDMAHKHAQLLGEECEHCRADEEAESFWAWVAETGVLAFIFLSIFATLVVLGTGMR